MTPINGATRTVVVIGTPIAHSLSPAIHNAAFAAAELDWVMVAFDVAAGGGADALRSMAVFGIRGMAVTMPHKADIAAAVDHLDPAAAALESVNTVVLQSDGSTLGSSTDGAGFLATVRANGVEIAGRRIAILGAGAAARSIVDAFGRSDVADVAIINRSVTNAERAAMLAPMARVGTLDDVAGADILVNTTPVGMVASGLDVDQMPFDSSLLRPDLVVADIVYHPLDTALLRAARSVGAPTIDGLGMLIEQARLQQQLWTATLPDAAVMRSAAQQFVV